MGEKITIDEHYRWIFENSVPGLPAAAEKEGLTPLQYMRRYGAFEVTRDQYRLHEEAGFKTPSGKLEIFSETLHDWGWPEHAMPGTIESHVARAAAGRRRDGPRPDVPHRDAHPLALRQRGVALRDQPQEPALDAPADAERAASPRATSCASRRRSAGSSCGRSSPRASLPGIVACSHHLGRWHRAQDRDPARFASAPVEMTVEGDLWRWRRVGDVEGGGLYWWRESGVHQNITFPVHPDPISGMHCWHQRVKVSLAREGECFGDIVVDRARARAVCEEWRAMARPATGELRRPLWLARAVRPTEDAYRIR